MPIEVPMGAISPTMESGQIVEWRVKVGDKVKEGDTLADVQTDKAVMPLESFDEGIVAVLCALVGQDVAVGKPVLIIAAKGEDPKAIAASFGSGSSAAPAAAPAQPKPKAEPEPEVKHEAQGASAPYREMTQQPDPPRGLQRPGNARRHRDRGPQRGPDQVEPARPQGRRIGQDRHR